MDDNGSDLQQRWLEEDRVARGSTYNVTTFAIGPRRHFDGSVSGVAASSNHGRSSMAKSMSVELVFVVLGWDIKGPFVCASERAL